MLWFTTKSEARLTVLCTCSLTVKTLSHSAFWQRTQNRVVIHPITWIRCFALREILQSSKQRIIFSSRNSQTSHHLFAATFSGWKGSWSVTSRAFWRFSKNCRTSRSDLTPPLKMRTNRTAQDISSLPLSPGVLCIRCFLTDICWLLAVAPPVHFVSSPKPRVFMQHILRLLFSNRIGRNPHCRRPITRREQPANCKCHFGASYL